jgi:hypothetical protein
MHAVRSQVQLASMAAVPFEPAMASWGGGKARDLAHVEGWSLGAGAAWQVARHGAEGDSSSIADSRLRGVERLLVPCFCFAYKHMGVQMMTWVSATSGDTSGISHLVFWEDESTRHRVRQLGGGVAQGLQQAHRMTRGVSTDVLVRGVGAAAAAAFAVARRHP